MTSPTGPTLRSLTHRLAVGVEPVDAATGGRIPPPFHILEDGRPLPREEVVWMAREGRDVTQKLPVLERHATCRHVLRYRPGADAHHVDVRLVEGPQARAPRRFVPRRLRIPLLDAAEADSRATGYRIRRPHLFPGAAYPVPTSATGLRGRVVREGGPVRWARVHATHPGSGTILARAHGDDRGEFFLLLGPGALPIGSSGEPLDLEIHVQAPSTPPDPDPPELEVADPLWDLPLEVLPEEATSGAMALGHEPPDGYTPAESRTVTVPLGRIHSETEAFEIPG